MAETLGETIYKIKIDTSDFDKGMDNVKGKAQASEKSFGGVGNAAKLAFAGVAVMAMKAAADAFAEFIGETIRLTNDYEQSITKIQALVGVGAEQVEDWSERLLEIAGPVRKMPQELADGMFFITSAGLKGESALEALQEAAKASAAGLGELETVADGMTSAINAYGEANLDAKKASDIMVAAVREGKMEAPALARSMGKVIPIAAELGVSFDQVGGGIAAITRTGASASEATTKLQGILKTMLKPAQDVKDALLEMGTSTEEVQKSLREDGLLATLEMLKEKAEENQVEFARLFPDVEALGGAFTLVGENVEANRIIFDNMKKSAGATDEAFAAMGQTIVEKMAGATASFKAESIKFGKSIKGITDPLQLLGTQIGTEFLKTINDNQEAISRLGNKIGEMADKIMPAIGPAVDFVIGWLTKIIEHIENVIEVIKIIVTTVLDVKEKAVAGVKALAKGFQDIFGALTNFITEQVENIKSIFGGIITTVMDIKEKVVAGVKALANGFQENIEKLTKFIEEQVGKIKYFFGGIITKVMDVKDAVLKILSEMISGIGNWLGEKLQAIVDGVGGIVEGIAKFFENIRVAVVGQSIVPDMVNAILDWFVYLGEGTENILDRLEKKFKKSWQDIASNTITTIQTMTNSVMGVFDAFYGWKFTQDELTEKELEKTLQNQARIQKTFALISIAIDTARAVMHLLALGRPFAAAAAGIFGLVQWAYVAATPIPGGTSVTAPATGAEIETEQTPPAGPEQITYAPEAGGITATGRYEQMRPIITNIDIHDNYVFGGNIREFALIIRTELEEAAKIGL